MELKDLFSIVYIPPIKYNDCYHRL